MSGQEDGSIARLCAERGLRMTGPRRIITEILDRAEDHPDAEELHRRAVQIDPKIALSTVYRTVRLLAEAGILERHEFHDGRARYESASHAHHDHLVDIRTGKVIEFTSPEIEELQARIARDLGYRITGHRLQLFGEPIDAGRRKARKRDD
ncbi:MAG: transcriptional repressor [Proteobacteria bacterium]|nr:transcriptional repressor [Pseudomonadota bacterium]